MADNWLVTNNDMSEREWAATETEANSIAAKLAKDYDETFSICKVIRLAVPMVAIDMQEVGE